MSVSVAEYGIQEAQKAMVKAAEAVSPRSGLGRAIKAATLHLHKYAVQVTHVDTGALRASHTPEVKEAVGYIYPSPTATNPKGQRPAVYGLYEHRRGGSHAFYALTVAQEGKAARDEALKVIVREMP